MSDPDSDPPDDGSDAPNPNHVCRWGWDGIDWFQIFCGCSIEERCEKPGFNGILNQIAETDCEP